MVRCGRLILASTMLALFVSPAWSQDRPRQRPGGAQRPGQRMDMMPGLGLLAEKSVQEELKMSAEQIEKAVAARKKETEALGNGGYSRSCFRVLRSERGQEDRRL